MMTQRIGGLLAVTVAMLGLLTAAAETTWAQSGPPKFLKVAATAPGLIKAGKPFTLTVAITIDKPYHIQGNPSKEGYIATVVKVDPTPGFKVGKITYPKAIMATIAGDTLPVYEGAIQVKVEVTPTKAGKYKLPVSVRYQGCNQASCYPPNTATATADVNVTGKTVVLL
jgi:thiol:disulfide interchange protein